MRAKFQCASVNILGDMFEGKHEEVEFIAILNEEGNHDFNRTNSLDDLKIRIDNKKSLGIFEPGKTYQLEINEI